MHAHDGFDIKIFIKFATGHTCLATGNKLTILVETSILIGFHAFGMLFP